MTKIKKNQSRVLEERVFDLTAIGILDNELIKSKRCLGIEMKVKCCKNCLGVYFENEIKNNMCKDCYKLKSLPNGDKNDN